MKTENLSLYPISPTKAEWLKSKIRDVPDYPKEGITFKDLTTLFKDPEALAFVIDALTDKCRLLKPTAIVGLEARGFIIAPTVAYKLGVGFVPIRKKGKLPYKVEQVTYDLEYGSDCVQIHVDGLEKGERVVLIDDLLATGGTAKAAVTLIEKLGATVVGAGFIVSLDFLNGRNKLPANLDVFCLVNYT